MTLIAMINLPPVSDPQKTVDQIMEYDRRLSEPFTAEELKKLFSSERAVKDTGAYSVLTEAEKQLLAELDLDQGFPVVYDENCTRTAAECDAHQTNQLFVRREKKASLIDRPDFFTITLQSGVNINVFADEIYPDNSEKEPVYRIRLSSPVLWGGLTPCPPPAITVQKNKLRTEQIKYMERKCLETEERWNKK